MDKKDLEIYRSLSQKLDDESITEEELKELEDLERIEEQEYQRELEVFR